MPKANINNIKGTLRTSFCRATYRTNTDGGYEPNSVILCACMRVIDFNIQLLYGAGIFVAGPGGDGLWILVFDTTKNTAAELEAGAVPYFPPKFVLEGRHGVWQVPTEWTPFNNHMIIVPSIAPTLDTTGIADQSVLSTYVRYSTKEMTFGLGKQDG